MSGKELVSYSPIRLKPEPPPKPVTSPAPPADIKTSEELYLIGLRAEQFHDPSINPDLYWAEALRRDPVDSRVNTALGIVEFKKARYDEAEQFFRKALERMTDRYTSPKDGEADYYLAATLKAQGKVDEAYKHFFKATWTQGWKAAGYYGLAEIATARGDMAAALDFVNRSIDSNALNIRAQNLKAAVLRHLGRTQEAIAGADLVRAPHRSARCPFHGGALARFEGPRGGQDPVRHHVPASGHRAGDSRRVSERRTLAGWNARHCSR